MAKKVATPVEVQALPADYVPSLKKVYREEIVDKLMKQFSYTTVMQVPKLVKITINEGIGEATSDKKLVEEAAEESSQRLSARRPFSPPPRRTFPTSVSARACLSASKSLSAT